MGALFEAAKSRDVEAIRTLLSRGADPNGRQPRCDEFPLSIASASGYTEVVRLLIKAKATVNVQDEDGNSALISASENGHLAVVRLLLGDKADVNARDEDGRSALGFASDAGHKKIVQLLLEAGASKGKREIALEIANKMSGVIEGCSNSIWGLFARLRSIGFCMNPVRGISWSTYSYLDTSDRSVIQNASSKEIDEAALASVLWKIYRNSYLFNFANDKSVCSLGDCDNVSASGISHTRLIRKEENHVCPRCGRIYRQDHFTRDGKNKVAVAIGRVLWNKGGIELMTEVLGCIPDMNKAYLIGHSWDGIGTWRA